jgi:hypothetical protein
MQYRWFELQTVPSQIVSVCYRSKVVPPISVRDLNIVIADWTGADTIFHREVTKIARPPTLRTLDRARIGHHVIAPCLPTGSLYQ